MTIKRFFHTWLRNWKALLRERRFRLSLYGGIILLLLAAIINNAASVYTSTVEVLSVGDIVLDNIPTLDLRIIYTFGIYIVMFIIPAYPIFLKPELVPFTAKTVAAFILIRAAFISMTHLGAPEGFFALTPVAEDPKIFDIFFLNDLFFSGHTGLPFLGALLFWENRILRYFLLVMTGIQGATVLFMHVHYSIDVFSAPFFTYAIYKVSDKVFNDLNMSFKKIVHKIERKMHIKERFERLKSFKRFQRQ
ncbi:hypothetical protein COV82_01000 [Candidatus Peregrinibacteria bacterium CG11_big_fil_rev_8_21_14_0_20_46_8]|nr:MAG: hypothetical protein COV82_01000 [Candidatus Peregrinibacteria bacterium CG11_big_fil_rev_8_21_14_0_20_46_8]